MNDDVSLLHRLLNEPRETEWLEWKHNNADPYEIGEYISALANSGTLAGSRHGYMVWGVEDSTRKLVGTTFHPETARIQSQDLEHWLTTQIKPRLPFSFRSVEDGGKHFVILEISAASELPVSFKSVKYIRVASHKKKLDDHPDYERRLWRALDQQPFEDGLARDQLQIEDIVTLLDYPAYFNLSHTPLPENRSQVIEAMQAAGLIMYDASVGWAITNLGALLFCKKFDQFPSLSRKALRVVKYRGKNRVETIREQIGARGYAAGFDQMIQYVMEQIEDMEVIEKGLRRSDNQIPEVVFRELIANALIHQDFSLRGTGPMVEIFDDRVEITNPGQPLISWERFVDSPPLSRNDHIARAARLVGMSEERGSGWDKVALTVEINQLPAPLIEVYDEATRVVVFSSRRLDELDRGERTRAIYLHSCLRYVNRLFVTNASVRERFGLSSSASASVIASRLIRETLNAGFIAVYDVSVGTRAMKYLPFWAAPERDVNDQPISLHVA